MKSFFKIHTCFWHSYFFWHYVGRKKYEFLGFWNSYFFWHSYFFGTMFGPKKVWVPFFWNSYYCLALILFLAPCWPEKMWFPFCWNPYFFWQNVWPEHVWVLVFPCFSRSCTIFLELRFFDEINVGDSQRSLFSRTLTLNTCVVELCFCFCGYSKWFHFIEIRFFWNPVILPTRDIFGLRTLGCNSKTTFVSEF